MAIDNDNNRFSMMNLACPWRGLNIVPEITAGGVSARARQAVMYLYYGIAFGGVTRLDDRTVSRHIVITGLAAGTYTFRLRTQRTAGSDNLQTAAGQSSLSVEVVP